jgi:hypothetical protein
MNRTELQALADLRLSEAKALFAAGCPDGSYYLAGYAIECALKACIAKRTREYDFPDKKLAVDSHSHDIVKLLQLADLKLELETAAQSSPALVASLDTIKDWSEATRYERHSTPEASDLIQAIEDSAGGLLPWIKLHW